jgi:hypothetical protein
LKTEATTVELAATYAAYKTAADVHNAAYDAAYYADATATKVAAALIDADKANIAANKAAVTAKAAYDSAKAAYLAADLANDAAYLAAKESADSHCTNCDDKCNGADCHNRTTAPHPEN